jgi:uncharacterized protein YggT (Ycf19 family)
VLHLILTLAIWALNIYYWLIFARILLSWMPFISPFSPAARLLADIVDPFLKPFRKVLPQFGGIDFSPILAIIVLIETSSIFNNVDLALSAHQSLSVALPTILLNTLSMLFSNILFFIWLLILIRFLLSLLDADSYHPVVMGIRSLTTPFVKPFMGRKYRKGNFDTPTVFAFAFFFLLWIVWYYFTRAVFPQIGGG